MQRENSATRLAEVVDAAETPIAAADQQDLFMRACAHVFAIRSRLSMKERLQLYALYKQALCGDAGDASYKWHSVIEQAKHQAWSARRGMSEVDAKEQYIEAVSSVLGTAWRGEPSKSRSATPSLSLSPSPSFAEVKEVASDEAALRRQIAKLQMQLASTLRRETQRGWLYVWAPHSGSWLQASGSSRWRHGFFVLRESQLLYFKVCAGRLMRTLGQCLHCVIREGNIHWTERRATGA